MTTEHGVSTGPTGRRAVITGGSRRIGTAEVASVAINYHGSAPAAEELAGGGRGGDALATQADLSDPRAGSLVPPRY